MKIYQSYLGEHQKSHLAKCAIPYNVARRSPPHSREYELFQSLHDNHKDDSEKWGLVSWKFEHKVPVALTDFSRYAESMLNIGADCVFINPMLGNEAIFLNVWEQWGFGNEDVRTISEFLKVTGLSDTDHASGVSSFAFCNYFVANKKFWDAYFIYVNKAILSLERELIIESKVGNIYGGSAGYEKDSELTMRPFVIERLLSPFIAQSQNLRCVAYPYNFDHYEKKFTYSIGKELYDLSSLKNEAIRSDNLKLLQEWDIKRRLFLGVNGMAAVIFNLDDPSEYFLKNK
jgi:hypothetical protein